MKTKSKSVSILAVVLMALAFAAPASAATPTKTASARPTSNNCEVQATAYQYSWGIDVQVRPTGGSQGWANDDFCQGIGIKVYYLCGSRGNNICYKSYWDSRGTLSISSDLDGKTLYAIRAYAKGGDTWRSSYHRASTY